MEENIIGINEYMYFDKECGRFFLTSEALEIIYRKKNIICSYSGANEWIHHFACEMLDLYSGSSKYNYSLGQIVHENELHKIFKQNKDGVIEWIKRIQKEEWGSHMFATIKYIIDDLVEV